MSDTVRFLIEANRPVLVIDPLNSSGDRFDTDRMKPKLLKIFTAKVKLMKAKTIFMLNYVVWDTDDKIKILQRFYTRNIFFLTTEFY